MLKLLNKEIKLSASPLSFFFLAAALLTFVPGYPLLIGAFFITLGIFYSFQSMRENNDLGYSLLLPLEKSDFVKGKFAFSLFTELCGFVLMTVFTLIRMLFLSGAAVYKSNPLMSANLVFLGFALFVFGIFNLVFIGGFFKTAYYFGKPFIIYVVICMLTVAAAEALYHFPRLEKLNSLGFENLPLQLALLCVGALLFSLLTAIGYKKSVNRFMKIDL